MICLVSGVKKPIIMGSVSMYIRLTKGFSTGCLSAVLAIPSPEAILGSKWVKLGGPNRSVRASVESKTAALDDEDPTHQTVHYASHTSYTASQILLAFSKLILDATRQSSIPSNSMDRYPS